MTLSINPSTSSHGPVGMTVAFTNLTTDKDYTIGNNITVAATPNPTAENPAEITLGFDHGRVKLNGTLNVGDSNLNLSAGNSIATDAWTNINTAKDAIILNGTVTGSAGSKLTLTAGNLLVTGETNGLSGDSFKGTIVVQNGARLMLGQAKGVAAKLGDNVNLQINTGGTLSLNNSGATYKGALNLNGGTLLINDGDSGAYEFSGAISITQDSNMTATWGKVTKFSGNITGTGKLTIAASDGSVYIQGNNDGFSGGIEIGSYTSVFLDSDGTLGTGETHLNSANAKLLINKSIDLTNDIRISQGSLQIGEGNIVNLGGTVTKNGGSIIVQDAATLGVTQISLGDNAAVSHSGRIDADGDTTTGNGFDTGRSISVITLQGSGSFTEGATAVYKGQEYTIDAAGNISLASDFSTYHISAAESQTTSAMAAAAAANGGTLESVVVDAAITLLTVDSASAPLTIAGDGSIGTLTVQGTAAQPASISCARGGKVTNLEVSYGTYTATSSGSGDGVGAFTSATVGEGGTLVMDLVDALGWAAGSATSSITMEGGADQGELATLKLGARQTMRSDLTLSGNTLVTLTESPTGTDSNIPALDLYGGNISVTGTNNVNEAGMRIRGDGSSTITVNDDSQFTQKGDIFNHNEGTATKAGEGTLRIEGISKFNGSTIETQAGKTEIAGKVENGKFLASGGEVVVKSISDETGHSFTALDATAGQITLADNAKLTMKEIPTDTGTGTTTNALSVDGATLKVGANNSVTGNVTIGQTGVLTIGATDASALTVTGTLAFGEGATVNLTGLNVTGAGDLTLASATTISATTVNVTGLGLDTSLYQWALYAGSKVVAASDSSLVGTTAVYADGGDLVLSVSDLPSTTLTETTVSAVAVTGTNIQLTVADSLAGVTGGFNVKVGEDMWDAIVQGLDGNGGVYQNGTVTLTDGVNTLDWATLTAPVTLNGYAGTGTAGEYFVAFIPEPATGTLSVLALAALAARRRRKH